MAKKVKFNPTEVRAKIRKLYDEAKKDGKYLPPTVARAMALSMLAKK